MTKFFDLYLEYTINTEAPTFFHRWCSIASLGAYLGRQCYFHHGFFTLYPNQYVMLIGSPGTKKSSAIKISAALLKKAGYRTFAARKTRQEKFLLDLAEGQQLTNEADILDQNIFGDEVDETTVSEVFVAADEFNNFIGVGNLDFMSILGELWDYDGVYDYKLKNSKSILIPNPTVSILGGNTATGVSIVFPTEAMGQGFFSRLLFVYSEEIRDKITFPPPPDKELELKLIEQLHLIKEHVKGEITLSPDAQELIDKIYKSWENISDVRFEHYSNRRLAHLLKLTIIFAAADLKTVIDTKIVVLANTLLTYTEFLMPKALGEFGKARNSDVTHKLMTVLDNAVKPVTVQELWKHVAHDLERRDQMLEILGNLTIAEKIQAVDTKGYLPIKELPKEGAVGVDYSLFPEIER